MKRLKTNGLQKYKGVKFLTPELCKSLYLFYNSKFTC